MQKKHNRQSLKIEEGINIKKVAPFIPIDQKKQPKRGAIFGLVFSEPSSSPNARHISLRCVRVRWAVLF